MTGPVWLPCTSVQDFQAAPQEFPATLMVDLWSLWATSLGFATQSFDYYKHSQQLLPDLNRTPLKIMFRRDEQLNIQNSQLGVNYIGFDGFHYPSWCVPLTLQVPKTSGSGPGVRVVILVDGPKWPLHDRTLRERLVAWCPMWKTQGHRPSFWGWFIQPTSTHEYGDFGDGLRRWVYQSFPHCNFETNKTKMMILIVQSCGKLNDALTLGMLCTIH